MHLMLIGVAAISLLIGEWSTGTLVSVLAGYNVIQGGREEMKALAAVDALATLQMTMAYAVMAFGTLATGLATRRDPERGLVPPAAKALGIFAIPAIFVVVTTVWEPFQKLLLTQPLTANQWLVVLGLAVLIVVVVETEKAFRRHRLQRHQPDIRDHGKSAPRG